MLCTLVGGALGFLPYNFSPAKIFLGDTGSLFIGYVFATVSLLITAKIAVTVSLLVPLVALALPVVDTAAAILRRPLLATQVEAARLLTMTAAEGAGLGLPTQTGYQAASS